MNFLTALIDGIATFIRRNPLTFLIILVLAFAAPAVLKGIAMFALYFILGIILLIFLLSLFFRIRIRRLRQQMEEQFGQQNPAGGWNQRSTRSHAADREGEVKIYKTTDAPQKKVAENVGDYVDFEETKEPDTDREN